MITRKLAAAFGILTALSLGCEELDKAKDTKGGVVVQSESESEIDTYVAQIAIYVGSTSSLALVDEDAFADIQIVTIDSNGVPTTKVEPVSISVPDAHGNATVTTNVPVGHDLEASQHNANGDVVIGAYVSSDTASKGDTLAVGLTPSGKNVLELVSALRSEVEGVKALKVLSLADLSALSGNDQISDLSSLVLAAVEAKKAIVQAWGEDEKNLAAVKLAINKNYFDKKVVESLGNPVKADILFASRIEETISSLAQSRGIPQNEREKLRPESYMKDAISILPESSRERAQIELATRTYLAKVPLTSSHADIKEAKKDIAALAANSTFSELFDKSSGVMTKIATQLKSNPAVAITAVTKSAVDDLVASRPDLASRITDAKYAADVRFETHTAPHAILVKSADGTQSSYKPPQEPQPERTGSTTTTSGSTTTTNSGSSTTTTSGSYSNTGSSTSTQTTTSP